ncbi:VOC family protein [Streptomyces marincola]|uniref:VOC family protein n=1 Tax=Streptomyces marincola TaxID=2878388 RepID=UPI001CF3D936|nr:VOC family protein [Streptomyces marincola]UCM89677.1 glyoxalase/bleomycin resistance/dioxygenase family protein [Streptomyces marincola]
MTLHWKLVVDSNNAVALAPFWAEALGYEIEDQTGLVDHLLAAGQVSAAAVDERPGGTRGFRGYAAVRHPEDPFDEYTGIGLGRRLLFQDVPESKTVKNRLHIDIHRPEGTDLGTLVTRLEQLGATRVREEDQGPAGHWWLMRDPEGNEFCAS